MEQRQQQAAGTPSKVKRGPVHEGMRNHYLAFVVSIVLTALAFFAVMTPELDTRFKYSFIVILAIIQAAFQLFFWMHLKDRGHKIPIMFMGSGVLFVVTFIIMAVFWVWW
mgnify:CR=1 FL=1|jgi:cytochrome c oxidase subunit 4